MAEAEEPELCSGADESARKLGLFSSPSWGNAIPRRELFLIPE